MAGALLFTFKAKASRITGELGTYDLVKVPKPSRAHVDMNVARQHARFGAYANSDLFPALLARELKARGIGMVLRSDELPPGVTFDTSGFLAVISIDLS